VNGLLLPDFYSGVTGPSGCFTEGFSLRRLQVVRPIVINVHYHYYDSNDDGHPYGQEDQWEVTFAFN
jgi:hypothetical protein